MSVEATTAVREMSDNGIDVDPRDRFILYAIANYADKTGAGWPSVRSIERFTGYHRATIHRSISDLCERGLLKLEHRFRKNGSKTSSVYRLTFMVKLSHAATRVVADSDQGSRTERPGMSQPATRVVARCDMGSRTLRHPELVLELDLELKTELSTEQSIEQKPLNENEEKDAPTQLSATPTRVNNQQLLDIWNQHCGVLPKTHTLNARRGAALNRLRMEHNEQTPDILRAATLQVSNDDFWIEKGFGFDTLLAEGRVTEKAEKYAAYGTMNESDRRMANTAMRIMRAIGGNDAN